jgi:PAS domain S-box-containing protein
VKAKTMKINNNKGTVNMQTFRKIAAQKWSQKYQEEDISVDLVELQNMIKEVQIEQITLQLYNEELVAENELFSTIVDALPTAVFVKNIKEDYKFSVWNKKAEEVLGLKAVDCLGKSDFDFFSKEEASFFRQKDIEATKEKGTLDIPEEVVEVNNEKIILHTQKLVIQNKEGEPCFLLGISSDISKQKAAEQKIKESEETFRTLTEHSPDSIILLDKELKIQYMNRSSPHFSQENMIGKVSVDFLPSEYRGVARKAYESCFASGDACSYETTFVSIDQGVFYYLDVRVAPMFYDGKVTRLLVVSSNITERKKTNEALLLSQRKIQESESKFRAITEQALEAITIADLEGNYTFVNAAFCGMIGYSEEELLTMTVFDIKAGSSKTNIFKEAKSGPIVSEVILKRKCGTNILTKISGKSIKIEAEEFVLGVITDITQQRAAEDQLQKSKDELEMLFELSPDFMVKTRISDSKFIDINQRACEFYGYTKEEFCALSFLNLELSPIKDEFRENVYNKLGVGEVMTVEGFHKKKDGSTFPAQIRVCRMDDEYKLAAITDITDRKKKDAELMKLSLVAQKTDNAVIILDEDINIEWVNDGFEKMTGYKSEEVVGAKFTKLLDRESSDTAFIAQLQADVEKHKSSLFEIPGYKKNKQLYWRSTSITPFISSNGLSKYIVIESDITEQKRIADVIKKSEELAEAKQEIEKSEKRLNEAQLIAHIGSWELDKVLNKEVWSDQLYRIFELTPEEISPSEASFLSNVHPDDRVEAHESYVLLSKNKLPYQISYRLKLRNGKVKYVSERCQSEFSKNGDVLRSIGTIQDITEQKKAEETLNKSIKEIEDLKYALDESSMVLRVSKDLRIIAANSLFCEMAKYNEQELIGAYFNMADSGYHSKWFLRSLWKVVKEGEVWKGELKNKAKDGSFYWVDTAIVPCIDENRDPFQYVVIQRDITEKKRLEEELELANEAEFAKLYEQQKIHIAEIEERSAEEKLASQKIKDLTHTLNQTASVMIVAHNQKIISVNDKFCETSGYARAEIIGQDHQILDSFHHSDQFLRNVRSTIESGNIWQGELRARAKDGSFYWTDTSSVPFLDSDGNPFQYIVIQSDITERKQLEKDLILAKEEAVKNAKIKEIFLANMSHEIRTPMSGVLGFSRLLLQTSMDELQRSYAQSIYSSAENLLVVVNDILDVSKMESGKFQLDEIEFDLEKKINNTLNILKVAIQHKQLDLIINLDENIPSKIVGAPNRISQILINLIGNSIKFTKEGSIELSVTLQDNQILLFEVKDTGIGIPEDKLGAIFESFTQAENYTTREHGGTGLGLSICKKLVTLMGGTIGVESQVYEGATFFFTIPLKKALNGSHTIAKQQDKAIVTSNQTSGIKVLVVEDNLVNQELVLIYLNLLNCTCDLANNGEEALVKLAQTRYDLVLMDIQMPKMDGITATLEIRKNDTRIPIIAMTAHALTKEKEKCFEIGMNGYISKPFKIEELQDVLLQYTSVVFKDIKDVPSKRDGVFEKEQSNIVFAHLIDVMDGNADLARELILIFRGELVKFGNNMELAFAENDIAIIKRHMHKIKPNFELLMLMNLYDVATAISLLVDEKASIDQISDLYSGIREAIPNLLAQVDLWA